MAAQFNSYLDSLVLVPEDMHTHLKLVRDLDEAATELGRQQKQMLDKKWRTKSPSTSSREQLVQAQELIEQICVEKVTLASQAYDLLDHHIRRLDQELRKLEHDMLQAGFPATLVHPAHERAQAGPTNDVDMPVDPNEPVYCSCKQVAFGEMIGCDNPDCPIEWYHLPCVGLAPSNRPKQKWYCPQCAVKRRKGSHGPHNK